MHSIDLVDTFMYIELCHMTLMLMYTNAYGLNLYMTFTMYNILLYSTKVNSTVIMHQRPCVIYTYHMSLNLYIGHLQYMSHNYVCMLLLYIYGIEIC